MLEKVPSSSYKIRFIDCDPLGHLTNSRYIDYMLNAREDHVNKAYDLDYQEIAQKTGCSWVTLQNQIAYLKEVRYNQFVDISSKLIACDNKRGTVEILMRPNGEEKVSAVLWTQVIFFNLKTRKSANHTEEIQNMFQDLLVPVPQHNFQDRVKYLLKKS